VRDHHPDRFLAVHRGLFDARHVHGRKVAEPEVVAEVLRTNEVDADAVLAAVATSEPLTVVRKEHEAAAADFDVWGVPTIIAGDSAAFVRIMNDAGADPGAARATVERLVALVAGWPELNELKHTTLQR
jgi:2-hydroxychromene-2-carboxylate isomerase